MSKVVNLFGASGVGKSTVAAGLFFELKLAGYSAELVTEYAKEKVWTEDYFTLSNQAYVTIKQYYMQDRSHGKVQCVITDSPILLGLFYNKKGCTKSFKPYLLELFNQYNNINFMLTLTEAHKNNYEQMGRIENFEESREKERLMIEFLNSNNINYINVPINGRETLYTIYESVVKALPKPNNKTF